MSRLRCLLLLACTIHLSTIHAQNIVPNPGFEDVNICTEYSAPCAPSAWQAVAPHISKIVYKDELGQHYVMLTMQSRINPAFRSYCQTQLLCPLEKGQTYKLRLFTMSNQDQLPLPDIRFDTAPVFRNLAEALELPASLHLTKKDIVRKYYNWTILEKTFTADNDAGYIVIGNFSKPAAIYKQEFYLYLDSVTITPLSGKICKDADTVKAKLYAFHKRHSYYSPNAGGDGSPFGKATPVLPLAVFQRSGICDTILLRSDFFLPRSKDVNPSYLAQLESTMKVQRDDVRNKIMLTGYSHKSPNPKYNEIMAQDRANAVATYLVYKQGFSYDDFIITGLSKPSPGEDSSEVVELISCQPAPELTAPVIRTDTLLIPDLLFKVNSHELNTTLHASLDSLIGKISVNDSISVTVTGHTDNTGTSEYNQELSMRRAVTVADYIRTKKSGSNITQVNGMGESMPVADNNTAAGRRKNRRVEIIIYHLPKNNLSH